VSHPLCIYAVNTAGLQPVQGPPLWTLGSSCVGVQAPGLQQQWAVPGHWRPAINMEQ